MRDVYVPLFLRTGIFILVLLAALSLWIPSVYATTVLSNIGETNDKSTTSVRSNVWKAWKFTAGGPATITSVTMAVDLVQSVTGLDIKFYNDNNGNLGTQIGGYLDYTSTNTDASQATYGTLVGNSIVIPSAGSYWIGLVPPSSANIYLKLTSSTNETGIAGWEMFLGNNGFVSFYSGQFYNNTATIGTLMLTMSGDTTDETAPTISTLSPADGATTTATTANLVMTFSEAVDAETGNITIKKGSDNSTIETIAVTSGQVTGSGTATITINPSSNLLENTAYYVQVDATAFDDAAGNSYAGISNTTSWNFTTADASGGTTQGWSRPPSPRIEVSLKDATSVIVAGSLTDSSVRVNEMGFEYWRTKKNPEKIVLSGTPRSYRYTVRDLLCGTTYTLRGFTKNITGTTYTDEVTFETEDCEAEEDNSKDDESMSEDEDVTDTEDSVFMTPSVSLQSSTYESLDERDLFLEAEGEDVRVLQLFLIEQTVGPAARELARVGATGYFGTYTQNALGEFQKANGIVPHAGYFGPITRLFIKNMSSLSFGS